MVEPGGVMPGLQRYMPVGLLEKLESARRTGGMRGERRVVTMLFCDVVGSTAAAEQLDPEVWTDIMNGAFHPMISAIYRYEGTVARLMGDAILAFFGAPIAHEDDPQRAVLAGLQILEEVEDYRKRVKALHGLEFNVRVGINTGLVVVGAVGSDMRIEYTAMGDAVNLAARMEQTARPGTVQISQDTHRLVAPLFEVEDLGEIGVKGKRRPVRAYRVLRPRRGPSHRRGIEGRQAPLVGREKELQALGHSLAGLKAGQGQIVSLIGEAGMGKSRLIAELRRSAALGMEGAAQELLWLEGRALSYQSSVPYSIFIDIFTGYFRNEGKSAGDLTIHEVRRRLGQDLNDGSPSLAPFIGSMMGLSLAEDDETMVQSLEPQQLRDRVFQAVRTVFANLARRRPLLLVFDDLHWADSTSLELLKHILPLTETHSLMLLALYRPGKAEPSWSFHGLAEQRYAERYRPIYLQPLDKSGSRDLVAGLMESSDLPPDVLVLILDKAEGNPFFIEEVIRSLLEQGKLVYDDSAWRVPEDSSAFSVPDSLSMVITSRLDRLDEGPRRLLQTAAVIGRRFNVDMLSAVSPAKDVIEAQLKELENRDLIHMEQPAGSRTYAFKHPLTQETAYGSLLLKTRRGLHLQVAERLETTEVERVGEIARHFLEAHELERGLPYLVTAAENAARSYATLEALEQFSRAEGLLAAVTDSALAVRIYGGLGQVLHWQARYGEAVQAFASMLQLAEGLGDEAAEARALHGMAEAQMHQGDFRGAIASAQREEAVATASELGLPLARARWMQAWGAFRLGETERALDLANAVADLSEELGDRGQQAASKNLLGVLHSVSGHYEEAERFFRDALAIFRALGDLRRAMPLLNNLGVIAESKGDFDAAAASYQEALAMAREIGNRDGEMVYLGNLGGIKVRQGEFTTAEADLRSVLSMSDVEGMDVLSNILSFLAEACVAQGKLEEALDTSRRALDTARMTESQDDLGAAWRVMGMVAACLQEAPILEHSPLGGRAACDAATCFAESERIFREIGRDEELARTLRTWAVHDFDLGKRDQAVAKWKEARELFERIGAEQEVARMAEDPVRSG